MKEYLKTETDNKKFMKEKLLQVCEMVANDVENDAKEFDGKPFNGKTVATYLGNHGAAIAALSDVLKELINNTYKDQP